MILIYPVILFLATTGPLTLDQVRADHDPEHRAKSAIDFAMALERGAELANDAADDARLMADIRDMVAAMELARDSFAAAGKTPWRQPGTFKGPELRSHEMLHRLGDLQDKMGGEQKHILDEPIMKIQEIHDAWFEGIMGKKK